MRVIAAYISIDLGMIYLFQVLVLSSLSPSLGSQPIEEWKESLQELKEDSSRINALESIAGEYRYVDQDSALHYYTKAMSLALDSGSKGKLDALAVQTGGWLFSVGRTNEADSILLSVVERGQPASVQTRIQLYQNLAITSGELQRPELAIEHIRKAEKMAKENGEEFLLAKVLLDFGSIYFKQGQLDSSSAVVLRAVDIFQDEEDWENIAAAFLNLGINYLSINDFTTAASFANRGLEAAEQSGNLTYLAYSYKVLTACYSELGEQEKALDFALKSLDHWSEMGNVYEVGVSNRIIGKVLKERGEVQEAIPHLQASVENFIEIDYWPQLLYSMAELGDGYILSGNSPRGLSYLRQTEQGLIDHPQSIIDQKEIYAILDKAYHNAGQFESAYNFRERHDAIQDSIENEEQLAQIRSLEVQFDVKEKEEQVRQQAISLRAQRRLLVALGAIGLLAIGLMLLIYSQARQRKKVNDELRELDRAKSNFFANVSHELRTPLTLIIAPLEQLMNKLSKKAQRDEAALAHRNSQRLLQLVNEILDLSKLESGKLQLQTREVQLLPFLRRVFFAFESAARAAHLHIDFDCSLPESTVAIIDPEKLEVILNNLIVNALNHSEEGDRVGLEVVQNEKFVAFRVKDQGSGIREEDLPHIFDRYYQQQDKPSGGTGIGLALSRQYALLMGGDLSVDSKYGSGSIFTLRLPLILTEGEAITEVVTYSTQSTSANRSVDYEPKAVYNEQASILIVEDNLDMSEFLTSILSPLYRCKTALNGEEGLALIEQHRFDLITSDVMMPKMDGFAFLQQIHKRALYRHTPVILLTASTLEEDKLKALRLGVDDYMTKPFSPRELLARIENLLNNQLAREDWREATADDDDEEMSVDQEFLEKAEAIVMSQLANSDFKTGDLAQSLHYSTRQLQRIVRQLTGLSTRQFISEIRMQKAMQLLQNRRFGTIAEVALEVGFQNAAYFSKVFRQRFGVQPNEVFYDKVV